MKHLIQVLALSVACLTTSAFATTHKEAPMMQKDGASCDMQATEKKLAGAAKASFLKKCVADHPAAACETQATDKKLAGAAKGSFMKKCESDAKAMSAGAACETQAADKKLAGAAKASFVKKCQADAKAA